MYKATTKQRIMDYIILTKEIGFNKLKYLGTNHTVIHNYNLLEILNDLESENKIIIGTQKIGDRIYRTIKVK